jgi:hypothetical protein
VQVISAGSGIVGRVDLRIGNLVVGCGATVVVVTTTAGVVVVVTGTVVVGAGLLESNSEYASRF